MSTSSYGTVQYDIYKTHNLDMFQVKIDGFRYTDADDNTPGSYLYARRTGTWHSPDGIDYRSLIRDFDLCRRCDKGEFDEVFMQGGPYFGYYESRMAGRDAYWCNSSGMDYVSGAAKFIMMGFNYERGIGEMLEDYGHRTESIMRKVYGSWSTDPTHAWNRFTLYDKVAPGDAACGNVHYAPNSQSDYEWGNTTYVWSSCDDWLSNYPYLKGSKELVNCAEWGNGDMRLHHMWWFQHIPHVDGTYTEYSMTRLNNWWAYMQDFNRWPESGGDFTGEPRTLASGPLPIRITNTPGAEDITPQVNAAGRIVWSGRAGANFGIFSSNIDGTDLQLLTDQNYYNETPRINAAGRIVFQRIYGGRCDVCCINADGTGLVQITDNSTFNWHPDINDTGRIVWDSFDGNDYEIYSANSDGTDIVRITNNNAGSGMPRDDCWARINNAGRIVWMGFDGVDWEIYSANADGTGFTQITDNTWDDEYPQIDNSGRVAWHTRQRYSFRPTVWEIYSGNADGTDVTQITDNYQDDMHPQINSSGKIAWMGFDDNDWEVYSADADGTGLTQITSNGTPDMHPVIDDNGRIAWQGMDKNDYPLDQNYHDDWEIFTWIDGTVCRITDNTVDDRAPAVSVDSGIVWHSRSGTDGKEEIFAVNDSDTDADSLPDDWEMMYFGNLDHGPDGDDDLPHGDGATNSEELAAGTDPTDPSSVFTITGIWPGSITIEWSSVSGKTYSVFYSDGPYGTGMAWTLAESSVPASGTGNTTWTDTTSLEGVEERYYRVMVESVDSPGPHDSGMKDGRPTEAAYSQQNRSATIPSRRISVSRPSSHGRGRSM